MIESIAEISPVSVAMAWGGHGVVRRQRRLKWLAALRQATGEAGPLEEWDEEEEDLPIAPRARIADALSMTEQLRTRSEAPDEGVATFGDRPIDAADLARRMAEGGERALRMQARLGAAAVRELVGAIR